MFSVKVVIFLIVLLLQFVTTNLFAQNWQFVQSPTRQNLARLDMLSEDRGWAVSYDGLILHFDGMSWNIADSLDQLIDWDYSKNDSITTRPTSIGDIYTIYAQNDSVAWLAVNNIPHRSYLMIKVMLDNKQTEIQIVPIKIRAFDFHHEGLGIAVGENGGYLYENNKWTPLKLPATVDLKSVKIVGDKIFMCGEKGILIKGDGESWEVIDTDLQQTLRDLDFKNENEGWIVGDGVVLHYLDGNIEYEIAESTNELWAVEMINNNSGYAVGEKGTLLKYNGESWDIVELSSDADLHDIELIGESKGFIVGARGAILHLSDNSLSNNLPHQFLFTDQVHLGSDYLMDRIDDVHGITVADFNNDALPDVYITCYKSLNHLLLNQGKGHYKDFVIESGTGGFIENRIGQEKYEYGSIAVDFDRDNDTDLFLFDKRNTTRYFINDGNAIFEDFTRNTLIPSGMEIIDGAVGDFNEDGYPDIVLADEVVGIRILMNNKYNTFIEEELLLELPTTGIRAVKVADINGDNHQDVFSVFTHGRIITLLNNGSGTWKFPKQKIITNTENIEFINSITFGDFNIDGFNDIFLSADEGNDALLLYNNIDSNFYNATEKWGIEQTGRSYSADAGDYNLDGFTDLFISRAGDDYLYLNINGQEFNEIGKELIYSKAGYLSGLNHGVASCDIDNDGNLDLFVGNTNFWSSLLQNKLQSKNYIKIDLVGTQDSKEGIGSKIWIWPSGSEHSDSNLIYFKEVLPSVGLFSQSDIQVIAGVGEFDHVDVMIRFLNGDIKQFRDVSKGTSFVVNQTTEFTSFGYKFVRTILQTLNKPNIVWEIFKFILFAILIYGSIRFIEYRYNWRHTHTVTYVLAFIALYLISIVFIYEKGFFYNIFPFGMLLMALFVLILVNEPIRKINSVQRIKQTKLQEAGTELSRVQILSDATQIVKDTIKIIASYDFLAIYVYHNRGNVFLLSESEHAEEIKLPSRFSFSQEEIQNFLNSEGPITIQETNFNIKLYRQANVFPLIRKKQLLGAVILNLDESELPSKKQNIELLKYLFLQLAIALDNLRILNELGDHEKISAIGTFSSGIIHDLKNPIDGLRMIIELLREEIDDSDPRFEYVKELYHGITSLKSKLIHSFDFVNYGETQNTQLSINELLLEIVKHHENLSYQIFKLNLSVEDILIYGDAEQLKFVFENIIQNAIEASDLKEPIVIETSVANKNCQINIIDSGKGIPDEIMGKIFDMFFSTKGKSRGLGLTLAHRIINKHNGFINVTKGKIKGTKFSVVLPLISEV